MCGSEKKRPSCCSEGKKKRVKHGRRPLPDLNCPPPSSSSHSYDQLVLLEIPCSSSEVKKKRVKYGKRPLPDLNYLPPPHHHQQSSPSLPSSSRSHHYDKLLGIPCSSSEDKKKWVKHGKRPLPDLNYPPPHPHHQQSSPSLPSSSRPKLQLLEIPHELTPVAASKKRKMGERESEIETESGSNWMKAWWNKAMNYIISNLKKKKKDEDSAQ